MAGISESFFHMQERDCGSIYDMKIYVEPNEIEPATVSKGNNSMPIDSDILYLL